MQFLISSVLMKFNYIVSLTVMDLFNLIDLSEFSSENWLPDSLLIQRIFAFPPAFYSEQLYQSSIAENIFQKVSDKIEPPIQGFSS